MLDDTPEEARMRRLLLRKGLLLLKTPAAAGSPNGRRYVVGNVGRNAAVFYGPPGASGATLEEVSAWLAARSA